MRAYRWLLHLYPTSFRNEYGREMTADFAARHARATSMFARAQLWADATLDVLGNAFMSHAEILRHDLRYAMRALRRVPGFTITAVVVIAIGIGANTAAFSVADFVMLQPLPFATPDRLVTVWQKTTGYNTIPASAPNYQDWRTMSHAFDAMAAYHSVQVALLGGNAPQQLDGVAVTGDLFGILGVHPMLGHLFSAEELQSGASTVLLSYPLWRDTFGKNPAIVGKQVVIEGQAYTVAGVMPPTFIYPTRTTALYIPMSSGEYNDPERNNNWFSVLARLKPGLSVAAGQADMNEVSARLARLYPKLDGEMSANVLALREGYSLVTASQARTLLLALCGAALCVLLISSANLGNLLLVRALVRRRELAVRSALGAGRERLVRQLVTESLLLVGIGGVFGVGLAVLTVPLLGSLIPPALPLAAVPVLDVRVLVLAVALTLVTGLGFGVIPAIRSGGGTFEALRDGGRSGGGRRARLRSALVIAEVMMSVVLLVSTGLLVRAMWQVQAVDPGFRKENILTLHVGMPAYRYALVPRRSEFYRRVLPQVEAIPGVQRAGFISFLPMGWGGGIWPVGIAGLDSSLAANRSASLRYVTAGYLPAMQIALARGRQISDGDVSSAPNVAVVSASFAKQYWPSIDPIGQHFNFAFLDRTVVGVVHDVKVRGPERPSEPQVYLPYQQVPDSFLTFFIPRDLVVRSSLPTAALVPLLRRIIQDADPDQPISDVRTMDAIVDTQTSSRSTQARILGAFAAIALLLAAVGIHGVLAFTVSQRQREMGVRLALGARREQLVGMVLSEGAVLALAGVVPGAIVAYAAGRAISSVLVGVPPTDVATYSVAVGLALTMVLVGAWLPARRASRVEPSSVLRGE